MATDNSDAFDDTALRTLVGSYSQNLVDDLDRLVGNVPPDAGYFPPNAEWLLWPTKGKLVRLDVAMYAIHLAAARIFFKPIPHLERVAMEKTKQLAAAAGAEVASFKLLSGAVGFIFRLIIDFMEIWKTENEQRLLEQSIRANILKVMTDLKERYLPQKAKRRKRKEVASRHPSPLQRKRNRR